MMQKVLRMAAVVGLGWLVYGEINRSEAAHFDTSVNVVHRQSDAMGATMGGAGAFVGTEIAKITSLSALFEEWTPRYRRAQAAYPKFDAAIVAAEKRADAYFTARGGWMWTTSPSRFWIPSSGRCIMMMRW